MQVIEDLYRPYKQKRRTKATIAKERSETICLSFPKAGDVQEKRPNLSVMLFLL